MVNDSTVPEDEINYQAHSFGPGTVYHLIHECMKDLKMKTNKHRVSYQVILTWIYSWF